LPGQEADVRYLFEDYVLDDSRHELRKDGVVVPVEARIFDILAFLIRNRERVVSQEDLLEAIWEGRTVSISTTGSSMHAARVAIGAATGALVTALFFVAWPARDIRSAPTSRSGKTFDAATVPLLDGGVRHGLASYAARPDFKALAISEAGVTQIADGAPD